MKRAPIKCPSCKSKDGWNKVDETSKGGFSGGKAIGGAIVLGPVGLVAGALGKKCNTYYCKECGFQNKYK